MAVIICLTLLGLLGWANYATVKSIYINRPRPVWWVLLTVSSLCGSAVGVWCAGYVEFQLSENWRFFRFPIPVGAFHLENGVWVDYISPYGLFIISFDFLIVVLAFLLPLSVAWLIRCLLFRRR